MRAQEEPRVRKPRRPTLASVSRQANKAAIFAASQQQMADGTGGGEEQAIRLAFPYHHTLLWLEKSSAK